MTAGNLPDADTKIAPDASTQARPSRLRRWWKQICEAFADLGKDIEGAPEPLKLLYWLWRTYPKHWVILTPVVAVTATLTIIELIHVHKQEAPPLLAQAVKDLRTSFADAREELANKKPASFKAADIAIGIILRSDPTNGHGYYYRGEIQRVSQAAPGDAGLFTIKSCINPAALKPGQRLDEYESDFLRYLDIEKSLPLPTEGRSPSAENCSTTAHGYCAQRTGWIEHLLANDFFALASVTTDPVEKRRLLEASLKAAQRAAKLYHADANTDGFTQCIPTDALINRDREALVALP